MKKIWVFIILILCLFTACSKSPWKEQYELGLKYLTEGNYEEAILSFTAAIEIDPKQPLIYIGRGDSYFAYDELENHFALAITDYETVLDIDEMYVDAYLRLADVYFALGDSSEALGILQKGYSITGDNKLKEYMEKAGYQYVKNVSAYLILNDIEHREELDALNDLAFELNPMYGEQGYWKHGIRFNSPIQTILGSNKVTEASVIYGETSGLNHEMLVTKGVDGRTMHNMDYFGKSMLVSGWLSYDEGYQRVSYEEGVPTLYPNGPYTFLVTEWVFE